MENKLISIIYDLLKDKNLYNFDNDKSLRNDNVEMEECDIYGAKCIRVWLQDEEEEYIIRCNMSFKGRGD